jgi:3-hydroxy-9,10-secoandrosta-1,3,5(10)-triene-9,17-dione monooxygenase
LPPSGKNAADVRSAPPLAEELIERTAALAPSIASRAGETERLRRLPSDIFEALRDAGLFRLYQPARFGGYELPYGTLQLALSSLLGAACGSTAWVQSVLAVHAWMLGSFHEAAQKAVWGENPTATIATATAPVDGAARVVAGGLVLEGTWEFASGCESADWIVFRANVASLGPRWCVVPRTAVEIVDVWYATGLRGSGSQNVRVHDLFVADELTLDVLALRGSQRPYYGLPYIGVFQFAICLPVLGLARGALARFQRETRSRPDRQRAAARQLRFAQSTCEVEAAELLLARTGAELAASASEGRLLKTGDRIGFKRDAAFAARLCRSAVDRLVQVGGAHGVADANPLQRALRDIAAIASHHGLDWDTSGELFGSFAFGIDPTDPMLLQG